MSQSEERVRELAMAYFDHLGNGSIPDKEIQARVWERLMGHFYVKVENAEKVIYTAINGVPQSVDIIRDGKQEHIDFDRDTFSALEQFRIGVDAEYINSSRPLREF